MITKRDSFDKSPAWFCTADYFGVKDPPCIGDLLTFLKLVNLLSEGVEAGANFKVLCISPFNFSILASSFGVGCPFRLALALFCVSACNCCFKERLFWLFIRNLRIKTYSRIDVKPFLE